MKNLFAALVVVLLPFALTGCGDAIGPGAVKVAYVHLGPAELALRVGDADSLTLRVLDAGGKPVRPDSVAWLSSNQSVAWVKGGLVTALAEGTAVITAVVGSHSDSIRVTVGPPRVTAVRIVPDSAALPMGSTVRLGVRLATVAGLPLTGPRVEWTSADTGVAVVDSVGVVTARRMGTTTVRATSEGRADTAQVRVLAAYSAISAGSGYGCAISLRARLYCWGSNSRGQLGVETGGFTADAPLPVPLAGPVAAVTTAFFSTCALLADGQAYCWGDNSFGQLGVGPHGEDRGTPGAVQGGLRFRTIATGGTHTCALTPEGSAYCWGNAREGALGIGEALPPETCTDMLRSPCSTRPLPVAGGHTFTTIGVGYHSSCALTVQGRAYCWGLNEDGALGTGTTENARAPVPVAGGLAFSALSVSTHSCALTIDGEVYCWGANTRGQLGNGEGGFRVHSTAPVRAQTDLRFAAISVGANSCALTSAGVAHCWGLPGQQPTLPRPALEENLRFRQLHVGGKLTCGIVENGVAYCWETWSRLPPYSAVRLREPQRP